MLYTQYLVNVQFNKLLTAGTEFLFHKRFLSLLSHKILFKIKTAAYLSQMLLKIIAYKLKVKQNIAVA